MHVVELHLLWQSGGYAGGETAVISTDGRRGGWVSIGHLFPLRKNLRIRGIDAAAALLIDCLCYFISIWRCAVSVPGGPPLRCWALPPALPLAACTWAERSVAPRAPFQTFWMLSCDVILLIPIGNFSFGEFNTVSCNQRACSWRGNSALLKDTIDQWFEASQCLGYCCVCEELQ